MNNTVKNIVVSLLILSGSSLYADTVTKDNRDNRQGDRQENRDGRQDSREQNQDDRQGNRN
ncbi:hypothetical protein HW115_16570 [Verrucomicrobiaceae bacterium N1E253]|uniref:Uncharacterized protein n=1 Tax=Oceaniferula marina TaxID=2748318 RepID=A0A851GHH3_9BACT|nr:hypothetical protein [Oceaniferula marina]NWK57238.1 hypothetical protein [Oceaniferula marina]